MSPLGTSYRADLESMQKANELPSGPISAYLLVTDATPDAIQTCTGSGIKLTVYNPGDVLRDFYMQISQISEFGTLRPKDYGVWNIHLINRALYALLEYKSLPQLVEAVGLSRNSLANHLRLAEQLGLIRRLRKLCLLTEDGYNYVQARDHNLPVHSLSEKQTEVLRNIIVKDPFISPTVLGIYGLVEIIFILARNSYPVAVDEMIPAYRDFVGKKHDWTSNRPAFLGARAFMNFGVELGLLAKVGSNVYLTPTGFRFVTMLQLYKGIKLVDALQR